MNVAGVEGGGVGDGVGLSVGKVSVVGRVVFRFKSLTCFNKNV